MADYDGKDRQWLTPANIAKVVTVLCCIGTMAVGIISDYPFSSNYYAGMGVIICTAVAVIEAVIGFIIARTLEYHNVMLRKEVKEGPLKGLLFPIMTPIILMISNIVIDDIMELRPAG